MKTFVLEQPGRLTYVDGPTPGHPGPGEARVRVERVGVCGTDLHAYRGRQPFFSYPRVPGHELGVEVVEVGPGVERVRAGERCAVEPYLHCGRCIACRAGRSNCCVDLKVLGVHVDGGLREAMIVPANTLHRSAALSFDQLALVETLSIGAHAVGRADLKRDEWVLVIGAGPIGLSVIQSAISAGARVIAMDLAPHRLDFCGRWMPVEATLAATEGAPGEIERLTGGDGPTAVFDATGDVRSMNASFGYAAHGGRIVLVGLAQADVTFHDPEFHRRELTLLASRNATADDFARVMRRMESGELDTTAWITHRAAFDEVIEHFPAWLRPETGVIKAMVTV